MVKGRSHVVLHGRSILQIYEDIYSSLKTYAVLFVCSIEENEKLCMMSFTIMFYYGFVNGFHSFSLIQLSFHSWFINIGRVFTFQQKTLLNIKHYENILFLVQLYLTYTQVLFIFVQSKAHPECFQVKAFGMSNFQLISERNVKPSMATWVKPVFIFYFLFDLIIYLRSISLDII